MVHEDDVREGFVRQRRNLMIMSLVVLLSELTDINITKISIFGNEAEISNPALVIAVMWTLLIYWLVRYYQYFHETQDTGFLKSFSQKRSWLLKHIAAHLVYSNPKFIDSLPVKDGKKLKAFTERFIVHEDRLFKVIGVLEFLIADNPEHGGGLDQEEIHFGFWELMIPSIVAATDVLVRTRYFSEYLLPFALFLLPLIFSNKNAQAWLTSLVSVTA